jgi:hypothetical protein
MATPIQPTPPITGEDVADLLEELARVVSPEEVKRHQAAARQFLAEVSRPKPETPMLDKIRQVKSESQKIGAFLEWLDLQGIQLCQTPTEPWPGEEWRPIQERTEELLAQYFEIDRQQVESERQALLDKIREHG